MKMPLILVLSSGLLLAACSKAPEPPAEMAEKDMMMPADAASSEGANAAAGNAAVASGATALTCDNGFTIAARYDNSDPAQAKAFLTINGKAYALYAARTGSGARYTTESGMTPDMLLEWRTKGDEGMLYESPLDDSVTPDDVKLRATCKAS